MRRFWLLLLLVPVAVIGGSALSQGSNSTSEALKALRAARAEARNARYLDVREKAGFNRRGERLYQRIQFAPRQMTVSQQGRVVLWQKRGLAYSLRKGRDCYERYTDFDRAAAIEMRRDIVVARAFIHEARLDGAKGRALIRWRGPIADRGYRVEGRLQLDRAYRPVLGRERTTWPSSQPPSPWYVRRYQYPTRNILGQPPGPRCQTKAGSGRPDGP